MQFVNVSVANIYRDSSYKSEVTTQGLLWEKVIVTQRQKDFSFVKLSDGYAGWISNYQLAEANLPDLKTKRMRTPVATVKNNNGKSVCDVVAGCELPVLGDGSDVEQVFLPDGRNGYLPQNIFGSFPEASRESCTSLAFEYLGIPYFWGGRSPKGFDCSGFTQTVFGLLGISLPRDAWMQHLDTPKISDNPEVANAGDLYFFAENGDRITHVGIALGKGKVIHARGFVRVNSLLENDPDFDPDLRKTFVSAHSVW